MQLFVTLPVIIISFALLNEVLREFYFVPVSRKMIFEVYRSEHDATCLNR